MTAEYIAEAMDQEVMELGGISPSWLADQLDEQGVVRLRGAFSNEWLEAMRKSVLDRIAGHGDGDLFIEHADREIGSPAHQLMSDPALRQLFDDTARLRRPKAGPIQSSQCNLPIRNGFSPKFRPNLFHYDPTTLTMIVPIFIPRATVVNCGELAVFGNKRPFRRYVATHLVDKVLAQNSMYRRHLTNKVNKDPKKYIVDLQPGDAYVFWGYRQFHGNLVCEPGLVRATLVLGFGEVHSHSDSWALKALWRFSRSRRDIGRLQPSPTTTADPVNGITG